MHLTHRYVAPSERSKISCCLIYSVPYLPNFKQKFFNSLLIVGFRADCGGFSVQPSNTIRAVTLLAFNVTHISSSSSNSLFWADLHFPISAHTSASDLICGWHCALQKILFTYFTYLYQKFCLHNVTVKSVTAYIPVYMLHVATYTIVNKDFIYCIFLSHHLPVNAYLSCSGERRLGWPSSPH